MYVGAVISIINEANVNKLESCSRSKLECMLYGICKDGFKVHKNDYNNRAPSFIQFNRNTCTNLEYDLFLFSNGREGVMELKSPLDLPVYSLWTGGQLKLLSSVYSRSGPRILLAS